MNQNLGILDEDHNLELQPLGDAHDQLLPQNRGDGKIQRQPPAPHPQEYSRGYDNITYSDGPLVLPPQPYGYTFGVTSSLMQMLIARGLFSGLPSKDIDAHISRLRLLRMIFEGSPDINLDVIWLRVFPLTDRRGRYMVYRTPL